MRALGQYSVALGHWSPGSELLAVSHLFMGVAEAIKNACWRHAARVGNKSLGELATEWGYDPERGMSREALLEEQARVRLVFGGDIPCHRKAKDISDAFEHGFENPGSLFDPAREVLIETARYLCQAVFALLELTEETRSVLEGERCSRPRGPPKLETYLHGTLLSPRSRLQYRRALPFPKSNLCDPDPPSNREARL